MKGVYFVLILSSIGSALRVLAQEAATDPRDTYQLRITRSTAPITIDGRLTEDAWRGADVATNFWLKFPRDDVKAERRTEVRITYDDKFLYISAVCFDTSYYVVQTLKRDSRFFEGDGFGVVLDPVNERANGFLLGVSPMNVQSEDLISPTAFGELSFSWDNKWYSEVGRYKDKWIVEIGIPFKTLRFKAGNDTWGINFFRYDLKRNEIQSWTNIPVNFDPHDIGYTGALIWDEPPSKTGTNISFIPYVSGSLYRDNETETPAADDKLDAGFDAKVALTSSLNLDLTINPDFSQIDVDVQQTNLTRFDLQYPERRAFFLENSDLFANFGTPPARPIFTRSIGLDDDALPIPIAYGARLSGNIGNSFRIGLMNLQTRSAGENDAQNYSIVTFNQNILTRSIIKGYATNRQAVSAGGGFNKNDYGRNAGIELNFRNLSGTWNPWFALHLSDKSGVGEGTFRNGGVRYSGRNFSYFIDYIGIDTDYYADMGFIQRNENYDAERDTTIRLGFEHFFNRIGYTIRPSGDSKVNAHEIEASTLVIFNPDWSLNERNSTLEYTARFRSTSQINVSLENSDVRLLFATQFTEEKPLPPGTYKYSQVVLGYESDARKPFAFQTELQVGGFYNGHLNRFLAGLTYRSQPWGNFSITFEQNNVLLPEPYGDNRLFLINQRTEINFSNKIFWTTFLQYNTQLNNFNVNSRLQWRYRPMSDLFLVYSDNYFSDPFMKNKNRAIVFKLNHWFTL
jgi:Domain of unknown function (DUF5916)/Carbohydrate family 9 binding domain-like